jgi:predicted metal-dependent hydrolase
VARSPAIVESPAVARLAGGDLPYTLRRSARARRLRVTIDARRGVIATVPGVRTGESTARRLVEPVLAEREAWIRRHLARRTAALERAGAGAEVADGSLLAFRGQPHRIRVAAVRARGRRSHVERVGDEHEDVLLLTLSATERRSLAEVLEAWLRVRARDAVDAAIARHAGPLGVAPTSVAVRDTRSRWGSASRRGRVMLAWRLVLAPPAVLETVVVHELCHLRVFGHGPRFWDLVATRVPDHAVHRRWLRVHAAELHAALSTGERAGTG